MTPPPFAPALLAGVMEATWPPARSWRLGPFLLRDGAGGGKRVQAASCEGAWTDSDLAAAEAGMIAPLFAIRAGDERLDAALAARGYRVIDPVLIYAAPVAALAGDLPPLAAFPHWPPLAVARQIWAEAGIDLARMAVMGRVEGPKCAILARAGDRPAGVAFVAVSGAEAMLHALEVRSGMRRRGD
ncbi:MAG: GNAT family N-acetyltransferase, partial [Tabrizicola sp.]|nr:GNAT family N-acetyltransferase [Tabrizicola sp.]